MSAAIDAIGVDTRRAHTLEVDVTGASSADQIDRRALAALDQAGVSDRDFVKLRLTGRLTSGVRWSAPGEALAGRAWNLRADTSAMRPEWNLDAMRHASDETTEGRFARVLLERIDHETDPEARATLERALYYGLDAFRLREVAPMWEEIGA